MYKQINNIYNIYNNIYNNDIYIVWIFLLSLQVNSGDCEQQLSILSYHL